MEYFSTNNKSHAVDLETAVLNGLAPDGGLYLPASFKRLPARFFQREDLSLQEIAFEMARTLLSGDLPENDLKEITDSAISFDAPLTEISPDTFALELFHGPTLAFKDFGARFMAALQSYFMSKRQEQLTILVATSGDTGGAVASGFAGAENINVIILYPAGKVSTLQELQLTTQGNNVQALKVAGTFDDCQALVKQAFLDTDLRQQKLISSANSINIARLIPQSFYYVYAYSQLPDRSIPVVFSVPSGNFGNLTAGLFAEKLGLPVERFLAATNVNDIVPKYLANGCFEPKASIESISNAMDVGNPSNFARMNTLFAAELKRFQAAMRGYSYSDDQTRETMRSVYKEHSYILDPHGAVALRAWQDFKSDCGDEKQCIFLETAHPAKFKETVEDTLDLELSLPASLQALLNKKQELISIPNDYQVLKELVLSR